MRGRKTGGRQAGTPNKATSTLHELVETEAGAPLPVLLTRIGIQAMKAGDHQLAVNALSRAAAYVYARMATADPPAPPLPDVVVRFSDPLPCRACGHDSSKDTHIARHVITGREQTNAIP
jgi:hypothetical protein